MAGRLPLSERIVVEAGVRSSWISRVSNRLKLGSVKLLLAELFSSPSPPSLPALMAVPQGLPRTGTIPSNKLRRYGGRVSYHGPKDAGRRPCVPVTKTGKEFVKEDYSDRSALSLGVLASWEMQIGYRG